MRFLLILFITCFFTAISSGQIPDSLVSTDPAIDSLLIVDPIETTDSTKKVRFAFLRFKSDPDYPRPKRALILSMIVPGAGQVYNGQWWKVPIVYGAIGGLGYLVDLNSTQYLQLKTAHRRKLRGEPHRFSDTYLDDTGNLRDLRDQTDKSRQLSYIGLAVVYILNGAEAFVSAHLKNFDVEEDLGIRFEPGIIESPYGQTPSIGITLRF